MSSKLNVVKIVRRHIETLQDHNTGKIMASDVLVFFLAPGLLSAVVAWGVEELSKDILALAVNFGAIVTALLMSVVVLVYDQENKIRGRLGADFTEDVALKVKLDLLVELYHNICFAIVTSLLLVVLSFVGMMLAGFCLSGVFEVVQAMATFGISFSFSSLVLTMLMVVKRFHILLTS